MRVAVTPAYAESVAVSGGAGFVTPVLHGPTSRYHRPPGSIL